MGLEQAGDGIVLAAPLMLRSSWFRVDRFLLAGGLCLRPCLVIYHPNHIVRKKINISLCITDIVHISLFVPISLESPITKPVNDRMPSVEPAMTRCGRGHPGH